MTATGDFKTKMTVAFPCVTLRYVTTPTQHIALSPHFTRCDPFKRLPALFTRTTKR